MQNVARDETLTGNLQSVVYLCNLTWLQTAAGIIFSCAMTLGRKKHMLFELHFLLPSADSAGANPPQGSKFTF